MSENKNPLLESLKSHVPGETFRLPSGGLFYKEGELDETVKNGEVHVYPMKTVDELVMKSPDKILTGKAVEEVFSRCIPEIKKPDRLLAGDVDYLMAALRVVSYGEQVELEVKHTCEEAKEHKYLVDLRSLLREARDIDPTNLDKNFKMELEGYVISIRPPLYQSVINLYQTISEEFLENSSEEEVATSLVQNLSELIEAVNDIEEPEFIAEWLTEMPAGWINKISTFSRDNTQWGIEYTIELECKDCGEKLEITVPTNPITFFT